MNSFRLDGVRVLVVHDASAVLDAVTAILVQNGASVTAVSTAEAALDVSRRDRPAVLVRALPMEDAGATLAAGRGTRGVDAASSAR